MQTIIEVFLLLVLIGFIILIFSAIHQFFKKTHEYIEFEEKERIKRAELLDLQLKQMKEQSDNSNHE